jgi:hypothetical protein
MYTIKDLKNFANEKGGECLSSEYKTNETIYTWKCNNNHIFTKVWMNVKLRNSWCRECITGNGLSSMVEYAKKHNGICLSTKYKSCNTKYDFQCENGHIFSTSWSNMKLKTPEWCLQCKAITILDLKKYAESKHGKCLSDKYTLAKHKYIWSCINNHIWEATWLSVGSTNKSWCKLCNQWSFDQIQEEIIKRNGKSIELISGSGIAGKYKFECKKGHFWITSACNIINLKTWCPHCLKLTLEIAKEEAEKRGGKCLDDKYINRRVNMTWICKNQHIFTAPLGRIRNNKSWCMICSINEMRHDISLAHEIANKYGGICHSKEYVNLETPLEWECKLKHKWNARLGNVLSNNTWCIKCHMIKRRKKCIDRVYKWIDMLGGKCLTNKEDIPLETLSNMIDVKINCKKGHIFTKTFQSLIIGTWCPKCLYKSEEACREVFEKIFPFKFPKKRLKSLDYLELDGYSSELGIAFEYDGRQHSEYIPHFHRNGTKDFMEQQERDYKKEDLCIKNGIMLIRIPHTLSYDKPKDIEEFISSSLEEIGS